MAGTYAMQAPSGHIYMLSREELDRLVDSRTDGTYRITNVVTRKSVTVRDSRPLTARDIARISNDTR